VSCPDPVLTELYGNEKIYLEKQADMSPIAVRMGVQMMGLNPGAQEAHRIAALKSQARTMNDNFAQLRAMQMMQQSMGPEHGMVRLASIASEVGQDMAEGLEKSALTIRGRLAGLAEKALGGLTRKVRRGTPRRIAPPLRPKPPSPSMPFGVSGRRGGPVSSVKLPSPPPSLPGQTQAMPSLPPGVLEATRAGAPPSSRMATQAIAPSPESLAGTQARRRAPGGTLMSPGVAAPPSSGGVSTLTRAEGRPTPRVEAPPMQPISPRGQVVPPPEASSVAGRGEVGRALTPSDQAGMWDLAQRSAALHGTDPMSEFKRMTGGSIQKWRSSSRAEAPIPSSRMAAGSGKEVFPLPRGVKPPVPIDTSAATVVPGGAPTRQIGRVAPPGGGVTRIEPRRTPDLASTQPMSPARTQAMAPARPSVRGQVAPPVGGAAATPSVAQPSQVVPRPTAPGVVTRAKERAGELLRGGNVRAAVPSADEAARAQFLGDIGGEAGLRRAVGELAGKKGKVQAAKDVAEGLGIVARERAKQMYRGGRVQAAGRAGLPPRIAPPSAAPKAPGVKTAPPPSVVEPPKYLQGLGTFEGSAATPARPGAARATVKAPVRKPAPVSEIRRRAQAGVPSGLPAGGIVEQAARAPAVGGAAKAPPVSGTVASPEQAAAARKSLPAPNKEVGEKLRKKLELGTPLGEKDIEEIKTKDPGFFRKHWKTLLVGGVGAMGLGAYGLTRGAMGVVQSGLQAAGQVGSSAMMPSQQGYYAGPQPPVAFSPYGAPMY